MLARLSLIFFDSIFCAWSSPVGMKGRDIKVENFKSTRVLDKKMSTIFVLVIYVDRN
jgi:hypothetical protein